jgi:ATP-dependent RNA helicase RhlE
MSFKKLLPQVSKALASVQITNVTPFGTQLFSAIKSGSHLLAMAPKGSGKTEAAIVACFDKVNKQLEGSPRVLYICSSIDEAKRVHEIMQKIADSLDVTVDLVHDNGKMVMQRNFIFNGTEIIVGTIKRVYDLFIQNGINFKLLDYLIIDDAEESITKGKTMEIKRFIEGFNKTQLICLVNQEHPRIDQFVESVPIHIKRIGEG